jgi:gamma-glutamyltranspeptidase/glutathione hydrolase
VTYPEAGNLGGGGFMLTCVDGAAQFLDYRETAPAAATRDMYLDGKGEVIEGLSLTGHRAVGVPGTVAGLWEAHQRYGRLTWNDVIEPAVQLAQHGFQVPPLLAERATAEQPRFERTNFAQYLADCAVVLFSSSLNSPRPSSEFKTTAREASTKARLQT